MDRIFLRALESKDVELTNRWHNDWQLFETLVGAFRYVSIDAESIWIEKKAAYSAHEINLMICLKENSKPIGLISVRDIDWISRKGYLSGVLIGEIEHQGKGYGTEALNLIIQHSFQDLGLNRIWTHIFVENEHSLGLFKKCGFQVEGHLKQHAYKAGRFKDVYLVGLCADQYKFDDI